MIVIKFMGGLGNQMFQYALYRKLKTLGRDVSADLSFYRQQDSIKFGLDFFKLDIREANKRQIGKYSGNGKDVASIIKRKMGFYSRYYFQEDFEVHFQPEIFDIHDGYLEGYWQTEKYFSDIRDVLTKDFVFSGLTMEQPKEILRDIKENESVSIHVRRGDYLKGRAKELYGGLCDISYYENAIAYIRSKRNNPKFFFFSDDISWVKENLRIADAVYIDSACSDQYTDMFLMTQCDDNIIANSSFSWWGAWLNENREKLVVSPNKWFNLHVAPDVICEDWIKLR